MNPGYNEQKWPVQSCSFYPSLTVRIVENLYQFNANKEILIVMWQRDRSITVPSTFCQTNLELAVVDCKQILLYEQAKLSYRHDRLS